MSENIDVRKINDEVQETQTDKHLDIRDLATVLQELTSNQQFDYTDWYQLGLYLGLYERTLKAIEEESRGKLKKCLMECICSWLKGEDGVRETRGGGSNWISLVAALDVMGEREVANNIRIKYMSEPKIQEDKSATNYSPTQISESNDDQQEVILTIRNLVEILRVLKNGHFPTTKWINLGLYLGLIHDDLKIIEDNYPRDAKRCLRECLAKWLTDDNEATWDKLAIAAGEIGETSVADYIISSSDGQPNDSSASIPIDKPEDTPATDRIQDIQNPLTRRKIENWLKEGKVELKITRINMHGAPGAGKTCTQRLLLNEPPPDKLTDSTPIACPAVKATRISIDGENKKWKRVDERDLLNQLASHLKEAPNETKHEKTSTEISEARVPIVDAPAHLGEPSLEEPTEKKPLEKKPTDMEVIKDISNALKTGNAKNLSTNWVYFIDSGGQPAYRELLPLFTRAAALNIITIDLTKGLDEKCKFQYRIDQHKSPIDTDLKYSNRDIIQSTISSEAMLNSIEIPYVSESDKHKDIQPRYFILGTRKELVPEEELKEMNESLMNSSNLDLKIVIPHIPGKLIIFPVNTLLPKSKEREEASADLCKAISNCNFEMKIELPIRLFTFEISLQREAKKRKRSFLTKKEVIEIGKPLRLDNESDINDALQYLHNVTIILYYPVVLEDIIFVDPEPILDVLSRLIAITYIEQSNLDLIAKAPDERIRLKERGLFKEDLLEKIDEQKNFDKKIFNEDFQSSQMIDLLKHLHIIAEVKEKKNWCHMIKLFFLFFLRLFLRLLHIVENKDEKKKDYFFPCALPSYDKLNDPPTEIQPLLIAWEIDNSGTTTLAIPQGLFPLTIVHLLEQKDSFIPVGKDYYRYHDAMSLCVYIEKKKCTIDIINRYTHIEIRFDSCKKFCPQIQELVTEAIKKSSKVLKVGKNHIFAFECPSSKSEQCYCIVKEDRSSTRCTQCRSDREVLQAGDDSYRCWFSDCQLANPGAEPSLEGPPKIGGIEETDHPNGGATAVKTTHVHVPDPPDVSEWCPSMEDIAIKPENFTQELIADVNIILVTATDTEYCAVMGTGRKLKEDDQGYTQVELDDVTFNLVMYGSYKVAVIRTGQGPWRTEAMLEKIQAKINAQYVIAIGICYGMKQGKTNIGDTIVAESIMDTSSRRAAGDKLSARPQECKCGKELCNIFSQKQGFKQEKGDGTNIVIHCSTLVSENTLVASQEYKKDILKQIPHALGGEMEGAGLMNVAERGKYEGIVIKAIADWGNEDKEPYRKWQKFAVVGAAKYVLYRLQATEMLKKKQLPIPHGGEANNED